MNKEQEELLDEVYGRYWNSIETSEYDGFGPTSIKFPTLMKEQFVERIKTDDEFSKKWKLKIEERELSEDERYELCAAQKSKMTAISEEDYIKYNIPTKLITITYNDKTIESYE
jgi:hypothetical protein